MFSSSHPSDLAFKYIVSRIIQAQYWQLLPCINRIAIDFNWRGYQYIYFASNIPVSDNLTLTKWIGVRNFLTQAWGDNNSMKNTVETYQEDKAVVESQPSTPSCVTQAETTAGFSSDDPCLSQSLGESNNERGC